MRVSNYCALESLPSDLGHNNEGSFLGEMEYLSSGETTPTFGKRVDADQLLDVCFPKNQVSGDRYTPAPIDASVPGVDVDSQRPHCQNRVSDLLYKDSQSEEETCIGSSASQASSSLTLTSVNKNRPVFIRSNSFGPHDPLSLEWEDSVNSVSTNMQMVDEQIFNQDGHKDTNPIQAGNNLTNNDNTTNTGSSQYISIRGGYCLLAISLSLILAEGIVLATKYLALI